MENERFAVTLTAGEGYRFDVDFDMPGVDLLWVDEPAPLGEGDGPNASRLLAAAVGNCLSASLLFCFRKARIETTGLRAVVEGEIVRNEEGRLRIEGLSVRLHPEMTEEAQARMSRCIPLFEDFCLVTESVRNGIEVDVEVEPRTPAAAATTPRSTLPA